MRAAICREFGQALSVENITLNQPEKGEVLVKIEACAICHSDISAAEGIWGGKLPAVYGHEAAGIIAKVGEGAPFEEGQKVLVTLIRACGHCPSCDEGDPSSCFEAWDPQPTPIRDEAGNEVTRGINTGAFAEYVVVDHSQCIELPEDIPFDVASLLACGVITGVGAVKNTAKVKAGDSVVVIGAGGVGLNAIQGAKLLGANPIIAVDILDEKLTIAQEYGATHGLISDEHLKENLFALLGGVGAKFVFVSVGVGKIYEIAQDLLAPTGAVVMVGMPPSGTKVPFDPSNIAAMNQKLLGSRMGQTNLSVDIPWLIECYRNGSLILDDLISGRYPLEQINEAIADSKTGKAKRNVIVFS